MNGESGTNQEKKTLLRDGIIGKSSVLFFSTVIGNVISLVGYFLLTKVYSMEVMGGYFSIFAISTIVSVFVHFGFAQAIPLMGDDEIKIGVTVLSGISILILILALLAFSFSDYLFYVLFSSSVISCIALIDAVLIREGKVKYIAFLRVSAPLLGFSFSLILGYFLSYSLGGLVGSYFFGMCIVVMLVAKYALLPNFTKVSKNELFKLICTYSRFPKFIGPGLFFHTVAYNLPSVVGLHYFGGSVVAAYNLAYKFVLAPMTVLGQAIGQAYISKLSHAYRNNTSLSAGFKLDAVLFMMSLLISMIIYIVFPWVAAFVFPADYIEISEYAIALIPLVFSMLSVAPLSNVLQFTNNQKKIFYMHALSFFGSSLSFVLAVLLDDFLLGVFCFSWFILFRYAWLYYEIVMVRRSQC